MLALGAEQVGAAEDGAEGGARLPVAVWLAPDGTVRRKVVLGRKGGRLWFDVQDALVLTDGGAVLAGETRRGPTSPDTAEGYLMRIGPEGQELWFERFAPATGATMSLTSLARMPGEDGTAGIMAAGRDGDAAVWLAVDRDGGLRWRKRGGVNSEVPGGAVLCGADDPGRKLSEAFADGPADSAAAVRRDAGAVLAFACGRGAPFAAATGIIRRGKDDYVILGVTGREGEPSTRVTLMATDGEGAAMWQRRYGDGGASLATAGAATADGGVALTGVASNWGRDVAAFKVSHDGILERFTALAPPEAWRPRRKPVPEAKETATSPSRADDSTDGGERRQGDAEGMPDAASSPAGESDSAAGGNGGIDGAAMRPTMATDPPVVPDSPGNGTGTPDEPVFGTDREALTQQPATVSDTPAEVDLLELLGDVFGSSPSETGGEGDGGGPKGGSPRRPSFREKISLFK